MDTEDLSALEEPLLALTGGGFEEFVTVQLVGQSSTELSEGCHSDACDRIRAFLCGAAVAHSRLPFQLCLLREKGLDVKTVVRRCAQSSGLFAPSVLSCVASEQPLELLQNLTREAVGTLQGESEEEAVLALAALDELEDDEVEIEVEPEAQWAAERPADLFRPFLPLTVLLNGERLSIGSSMSSEASQPVQSSQSSQSSQPTPSSQSSQPTPSSQSSQSSQSSPPSKLPEQLLQQAICAQFGTKPLACSRTRPLRFTHRASEPVEAPVVAIHLNTQCASNVPALDEVMRWVSRHEEWACALLLRRRLLEKVQVVLTPFTDVLIDRVEGEFQFRTPYTKHHIARAFAIACAVRSTLRPSAYWPFARCVMEWRLAVAITCRDGGDSTIVVRECADKTGVDVARMKECLEDEGMIERMWMEKVVDREARWITVSPYAVIGNEHVNRIDAIPRQLCELAQSNADYCRNMDEFSEGIPYCSITLVG